MKKSEKDKYIITHTQRLKTDSQRELAVNSGEKEAKEGQDSDRG